MVTEQQERATDTSEPEEVSRLLDYLPSVFREDQFMARFLLIFQSILDPLENTVDNMSFYFDPRMTPESILPWLASWVDISLDPRWSDMQRRELVAKASELYRWRGTRRGLSEYLRIYAGSAPVISEHIPGMTLGPENRLGEPDTRLGSTGTGYHFTVTLKVNNSDQIDLDTVRGIIDSQKPAHTVYTLLVQET